LLNASSGPCVQSRECDAVQGRQNHESAATFQARQGIANCGVAGFELLPLPRFVRESESLSQHALSTFEFHPHGVSLLLGTRVQDEYVELATVQY
jgi:hypothetical protein